MGLRCRAPLRPLRCPHREATVAAPCLPFGPKSSGPLGPCRKGQRAVPSGSTLATGGGTGPTAHTPDPPSSMLRTGARAAESRWAASRAGDAPSERTQEAPSCHGPYWTTDLKSQVPTCFAAVSHQQWPVPGKPPWDPVNTGQARPLLCTNPPALPSSPWKSRAFQRPLHPIWPGFPSPAPPSWAWATG